MDVYRVAKKRWCEDLSGEGARRAGGRWNSKEIPVLYASEHRSLCCLELLVHIPLTTAPTELMLITIGVPDSFPVRVVRQSELPSSWNEPVPDSFTRQLGDELLTSQAYGCIKVPSSVMEEEYNVLLNPGFTDYQEVSIKDIRPLHLDRYFGNM